MLFLRLRAAFCHVHLRNAGKWQQSRPRRSPPKEAWRKSGVHSACRSTSRGRSWKGPRWSWWTSTCQCWQRTSAPPYCLSLISIRVRYWRSRRQWCSIAPRRGGSLQLIGPTSTPWRSRGTRGLSGRSAVCWRRERAPSSVWHRWAKTKRKEAHPKYYAGPQDPQRHINWVFYFFCRNKPTLSFILQSWNKKRWLWNRRERHWKD